MAVQPSFIQLQTFWVSDPAGQPLGQAVRTIERDTYQNRVGVRFDSGVSAEDRKAISEVLSRNINMFGKGDGGGILWLKFKKGSMEQWVFAAIELEKRGYRVKRDKSTLEHTRDYVARYIENAGTAPGSQAVRT